MACLIDLAFSLAQHVGPAPRLPNKKPADLREHSTAGMTALIGMIGLAATWLFGFLDPNGFFARFLVFLVSIVAFTATVALILGRTLRDPWEHS